jgi:hypothetical protein
MSLRHHHLGRDDGSAALGGRDIGAHGGLRDLGTVFVDQTLPDPASGVTLLLRGITIISQPPVDDALLGPERRRRAFGLLTPRRDGRSQRLAHSPPVHPESLRQCPNRQPVALVGLPDLLVELHLRPFRHGPKGPRRLLLAGGPLHGRSALGGAKSDRHGGANSGHHTHV